MNDTIEVKLPLCDKTAVIRNYTTRGDDEAAEQKTYGGMIADIDDIETSPDGKPKMKFNMGNMMGATHVYADRLVQSIGGNSEDIPTQLRSLRSSDYTVIEKTVEKIIEENSPKANGAKNASKPQ